MKATRAWLLCLLLLGLALQGAASRAHQHSMEIRTPDIDPAWYMGRRIRPVGRFGRRGAALGLQPSLRHRQVCLLLEGGAESSQDE
ncbi:prolactin-releasing peptide [Equus asinus]|uniref:Prolactin releasing hormone n=3 Tax=Equus TaxID=9789 RepID=F6V991_HORSE|nr:prolactin-releasing peptide [Equus asinus]XP_046498752.1 prolactin-releasing peptide [Equus quagga]